MWGQPPSAGRRRRFIGPQPTAPPPLYIPSKPFSLSAVIPTRERSQTGEPALSEGEGNLLFASSGLTAGAPFLASFARRGIHYRHPHGISIPKTREPVQPTTLVIPTRERSETGEIALSEAEGN